MMKVTKTPATRTDANDTSIRELADREIETVSGARSLREWMELLRTANSSNGDNKHMQVYPS
jgi:hypothetical protein